VGPGSCRARFGCGLAGRLALPETSRADSPRRGTRPHGPTPGPAGLPGEGRPRVAPRRRRQDESIGGNRRPTAPPGRFWGGRFGFDERRRACRQAGCRPLRGPGCEGSAGVPVNWSGIGRRTAPRRTAVEFPREGEPPCEPASGGGSDEASPPNSDPHSWGAIISWGGCQSSGPGHVAAGSSTPRLAACMMTSGRVNGEDAGSDLLECGDPRRRHTALGLQGTRG
jgi:hypothetical protein